MAPSRQDDFDGYRKWLGISNKNRLPTHYELLGISLDEDDPEVIQAAAEQRRHFVESKRGDGHDSTVTEILYRISEAENTLLNNEMRRDYDRQRKLFEKRQKNRQIDPLAPRSRVRSRPGPTVGEGTGFVSTFAGILGVFCVAIAIMTWFSFQLPWFERGTQPPPTASPNEPVELGERPSSMASASTPIPVINNSETKVVGSNEKTEPSSALERMQAGDRLWKLAENERLSNSKWMMRKQAVNWYRKALPELSDEQRKRIEQQLSILISSSPKVSIAANQSWQIGRKVKRGDLLITVASDTWNIWPSGGSEWLCNANGTKYNAGDSFPIVGCKQGVLIGQIRYKVFVVGGFSITEAEDDGDFKLMCNDAEKFRPDNQGSIRIQIAVIGAEFQVPDPVAVDPQLAAKASKQPVKQNAVISSYVGKYRLNITYVRTRRRDPERILEFRSDLTLITSDGAKGAWKIVGGQLQIEMSGIKIDPPQRTGNQLTGTATKDGQRFRYELDKIND